MIRLLLVASLIFIAGCSSITLSSEGATIDKSKLETLKPGETGRKAVIETFGQPSEVKADEGIERLLYSYKAEKAPTFFFGVVQNEAGKRQENVTLEIVLKDGVLESYKYKSAEE